MTGGSGWVAIAVAMLGTGTILAALTAALTATVLRRCRPALHAALWTIVVLRFLVPPLMPGEAALGGFVSRFLSSAGDPAGSPHRVLDNPPAPKADSLPRQTARGLESPGRAPSAAAVLLVLYLTGFFLIALRAVRQSFRMWRRIRRLPPPAPEISEQVGSLARRIGLRRPPIAAVSADCSTPFVAGLATPRLVLPAWLTGMDGSKREPLILHELAHLRRGDLVTRALQNAARLLFFFWPPVWWACRRLERAMELACDQWVLALSTEEPRAYAATLLDVVRHREERVFGQALAFARPGRSLQERFEMILKEPVRKVSPRLPVLTIALLAGWAAFSLGGDAAAQEKKRELPRKTLHIMTPDDDSDVFFVQRADRPAVGHFRLSRWSALLILQPESDRDGDGEISDAEARAYADSRSDAERNRLLKLFPEADLDEDGRLGGAEILELLDIRLNLPLPFQLPVHAPLDSKELDTDGDGEVSAEEARVFHEKMLGRAKVYHLQQKERMAGDPSEDVMLLWESGVPPETRPAPQKK